MSFWKHHFRSKILHAIYQTTVQEPILMRQRLWIHCLCCGLLTGGNFLWAAEDSGAKQPYSFTRVVTHWSEYDRDDYLPFLEEAKPDIAQVGFYGAHFWSLAIPRTERVTLRISRSRVIASVRGGLTT